MRFFSIAQLTLIAIHQTRAAPVEEPEAFTPGGLRVLARRANPTAVRCGQQEDKQKSWSLELIQSAFNGLESYGNLPRAQKPAAGTKRYPAQYGHTYHPPTDESVVAALDAIPECATSLAGSWKWWEYPITDPPFTTGLQYSQGPDRVVAIAQNVGPGGVRKYIYCLTMTHREESTHGAFDPCTPIEGEGESGSGNVLVAAERQRNLTIA